MSEATSSNGENADTSGHEEDVDATGIANGEYSGTDLVDTTKNGEARCDIYTMAPSISSSSAGRYTCGSA